MTGTESCLSRTTEKDVSRVRTTGMRFMSATLRCALAYGSEVRSTDAATRHLPLGATRRLGAVPGYYQPPLRG